MRYVLEPSHNYEDDLRTLITFFVMARLLKSELVLGLHSEEQIVGVALVSGPGDARPSVELDRLRDSTWDKLGIDSRGRYEHFGRACDFRVESPHLHLNMIGVLPERQGQGLSRVLLEHVHHLSSQSTVSTGVSLTTETDSNVSYYEYHGYRQIGRAVFGNHHTTYGFFRPD